MSYVIVISDLHRGQSLNLGALRGFLGWVVQERPDIFLLGGDIHELAWFTWNMLEGQALARATLDSLRDAAYHVDTLELYGNHDPLEKLLPHSEDLHPIALHHSPTLEIDSVCYTHGHQFNATTHIWDTLLKTPLKKLAPWLYLKLYGTPYQLKMAQKEKDYKEYVGWLEARAELWAIAQGRDIVFGHTHLPYRKELHGLVAANSGDWQDSLSYVVAKDGNIEVRYWNP